MPTTQQLRNPLVALFQLDQDEGWVPGDHEWFQKNRISTRDFEFDTISVNGSNNLPNLKLDDKNRKVCLIEEEFMKRMWEDEQGEETADSRKKRGIHCPFIGSRIPDLCGGKRQGWC